MILNYKPIFKSLIIFAFILFPNLSEAKISNKIIAYVNEKIITKEDINQEIIYLNIVSGDKLKELQKKEQFDIALDSLISQRVKEIEIANYSEFSLNDDGINFYLKKIFLKNNIENLNNFNYFLKDKNYNIEKLKKKISVDLFWNNIILNLYSNQIQINKKKIKEEIESLKKKQVIEEYLISEIFLFEEDVEKLNEKLKLVLKEITNKGFEFSALNYSNSDSSTNEGELDWLKENEINETLLSEIKKLKVNEVSEPIYNMRGIFILKLNDKKKTINKINIDNEYKNIIDKEKNKQLNFFSTYHFNKLKEFSTIKKINE